ncbi:MAG: DMT family transporter [Solirubrobacterales bacterium]|nr:DMT family transporter [Solirubrobacterales bacterium]
MSVVLGLLAALAYGTSDFVAGAGGRRSDAIAVTGIAQPFGLAAAVVGLLVLRGGSASPSVLEWGALSGVGSGVGTVALYWGLSTGAMNVVSPLAAVISAVVPALVGVALGERLSLLALIGIVLAMPALVMVSLAGGHKRGDAGAAARPVAAGLAAGGGFALLFIGLDQAGTAASAWPLLPGQTVAIIIVALFVAGRRPPRSAWRASRRWGVTAGALSGVANLLYLAASGQGQLAIVAVLTALYPAITVALAAGLLHERMGRMQVIGLLTAAASVAMISV